MADRWNRPHETVGVGVLRIIDDIANRTNLGNAAGVQNRHPVGGLGNHAHIVGDQHDGSAVLPAQAFQECNDLCLNGYIQRRRWFIGDNQAWFGTQCESNDNALAHAAGKLMGIVADTHFGRWNADLPQPVQGAFAGLCRGYVEMGEDGFRELSTNRIERIEAGQGVLENRPDFLAADSSHLFIGQVINAPAAENDFAPGDTTGRVEQSDDGIAGRRFPGTGFADYTQNFTLVDMKGNIVDRGQYSPACGKFDPQVVNFKMRHRLISVSG